MSWAPPASLHLLDPSPPDSSESARQRDVDNLMAGVRPGLFALTLLERPTRPLGILSPPSGAVVAPDASLTPLRDFFPAVGG